MDFEVIKERNRVPRWRLRDPATGVIVPLKPGRVHLPPTVEENRRVRDAVDAVLTRLAYEGRTAAAGE